MCSIIYPSRATDGLLSSYGHFCSGPPPKDAAKAAKARVTRSTAEAEIGKILRGKVERIVDFGAFVNILLRKDGLGAHLSDSPTSAVRARRTERRPRVVYRSTRCWDVETTAVVSNLLSGAGGPPSRTLKARKTQDVKR